MKCLDDSWEAVTSRCYIDCFDDGGVLVVFCLLCSLSAVVDDCDCF